jgi:hypothetical protein
LFRVPGEDNIGATWKGFAQAFESATTHDDRMAERTAFEPAEILGQMPWDAVFDSDHSVFAHRRDGFEPFLVCMSEGRNGVGVV